MFLVLAFAGFPLFSQTASELLIKSREEAGKKDFRTALRTINKAIELDSLKSTFYLQKSYCLRELSEFQKAYDTYTIGIYRMPDSAALYINRGALLYAMKMFEEAIKDDSAAYKVAKTKEEKETALINLSSAKSAIRDFSGAYTALMEGYALDSTNVDILTNLSAVCDEVGREHETMKYLRKIIAIDSTNFGAYINMGFKYQHLGEHTKAIASFDKALRLQPDQPLAFSNRSYSKMEIGDLKGAMDDIEKSISLYPGNSWAYRNRGLIYIEMKKQGKACDDFQKALDLGFTKMYGDEAEKLKAKHCAK